MVNPTTELKGALAAKAQVPMEQKAADPAANVKSWIERLSPEMAKALPKHLTVDRCCRVVLTAIRINPKLLECTIPSMMAAIMKSAQLGLEVGVLNQAYLVPFKKNIKTATGWKAEMECQLIIGYEGYIDLFYRSGKVQTVYASEVYARDEFSYEYGLTETLKHIPTKEKDRGPITHFYAYVRMDGGAYRFMVWPKERVDSHAAQHSKSWNDDKGPWRTNYAAMGMKTMIRQLQKWIPKSVELRAGIEADESVQSNPFEASTDFVPFTEVPPDALTAGEQDAGDPAAANQAASAAAAPQPTPEPDFTAGTASPKTAWEDNKK